MASCVIWGLKECSFSRCTGITGSRHNSRNGHVHDPAHTAIFHGNILQIRSQTVDGNVVSSLQEMG